MANRQIHPPETPEEQVVRSRAERVYEWFLSQPATVERADKAVNLLWLAGEGDGSSFTESLLDFYQQDSHPQTGDELQKIAEITRNPIFDEIATQLAKR